MWGRFPKHISLTRRCVVVQALRADINKKILEAERQLESTYVSAKAAAQKKLGDVRSEL